MKIHACLPIAALLVASCAGCVQYAALVELDPTGSGRLILRILISKQLEDFGGGLLDASADAATDEADTAPDAAAESVDADAKEKSQLEEQLGKTRQALIDQQDKLGEGLSLVEEKEITRKGWHGTQLTYRFEDINKLRVPCLPPQSPKPKKGDQLINESRAVYRFRYVAGEPNRLEITVDDPRAAAELKAAEEDPFVAAGLEVDDAPSVEINIGSAIATQFLKVAFQGARLSTLVKVNGTITDTNAAHRPKPDSVILQDFDLGEFARSEVFDRSVLEDWGSKRIIQEQVPGLRIHQFEEAPLRIEFKAKTD